MEKTLGGDRLGSGNKMKVHLHNYERSTHDLGYTWRSTISAGTLVPFLCEVALPGDTFDINLFLNINTHPTIGPLFGGFKAQLDVFQAPIRLYNALLHNNELGIGMKMDQVKFPRMMLKANNVQGPQIHPSSILHYLGIKGVGTIQAAGGAQDRFFNAIPLLALWEIYKNYYANKQEEIGAVIHKQITPVTNTVTSVKIWKISNSTEVTVPTLPVPPSPITITNGDQIRVYYTGLTPKLNEILLDTGKGIQSVLNLGVGSIIQGTGYIAVQYDQPRWGTTTVSSWHYISMQELNPQAPEVVTFPLSNIDDMRKQLLIWQSQTTPYTINEIGLPPYSYITTQVNNTLNAINNQEGLPIKTYQSDLYNNWIQTEWIDGTGGINEITAIDTTSGSINVDTILLAKKVYDMLNRIAVSGGTYDDWLDAVYAHPRYQRCENPMYMGGLIKELVFQEVVSTATSTTGTSDGAPVGTLAGKGVMSNKHKGGNVVIKVDEPSYIIGLVSLTPRVDYSQGNKWDVHLETMDDLHKPGLDQIGFQELITEQLAWWDTYYDETTDKWIQNSAGKQPAWLNYMTNVNQVHGNFAIPDNEMFMTLNRRYEQDTSTRRIKDLTTYIDPVKFNFIFAETAIDAQNFWAQIGVDITARRKMSAKLMPNL